MIIDLPLSYPEKHLIFNKVIDFFKKKNMGYIKFPTGWRKTLLA